MYEVGKGQPDFKEALGWHEVTRLQVTRDLKQTQDYNLDLQSLRHPPLKGTPPSAADVNLEICVLHGSWLTTTH